MFIFNFTELVLSFGIILLSFSLYPILKLVLRLPSQVGNLKTKWYLMTTIIILILFNFVYMLVFAPSNIQTLPKNISFILILVSFCVLLISSFAFQSSEDLKKISFLEQENITDSLMQIYNRRYFDYIFIENLELSLQYNFKLSLMLLDIDDFKKINDTYGHQVGDEVLKRFGELLKKVTRKSDTICRYGGEEIAIISENTTEEQSLILANRIKQYCERNVMNCHGQDIKMTVSIGISSLNLDGNTTDQLIQKADERLYQAKKQGKNLIISSQKI